MTRQIIQWLHLNKDGDFYTSPVLLVQARTSRPPWPYKRNHLYVQTEETVTKTKQR